MARAEVIEHTGIVHEVNSGQITVKVIAQSACSTCRAATFCGAETSEKLISVNQWTGKYTSGEEVIVSMQESLGYKAMFWGYLLPFFLVLSVLIAMLSVTENEGLSGLVSLLILFPYYAVLYLLRNRFSRTFTFTIRKPINN